MKGFTTFLACLLLSLPAAGAVIRVPADQPTIQAGIDAAVDGDTVLVADGVYIGDGNRDIDLLGKPITVISEHGPENCIIDCEESELRAFVIQSDEGPDTDIEGFTITGGYWDNSFEWIVGGGILVAGASPVIRGNWIIENCAMDGAGILCTDGGSPLIEENIIADNYAVLDGGGIACFDNSEPLIEENLIINNQALFGGGITARDSSPIIRLNVIQMNTAGRGGMSGTGAGLYCGGQTLVEGNMIERNHAMDSYWDKLGIGGGIFACDAVTIVRNTITGNGAAFDGGAIFCHDTVRITGNRIENNGTRSSSRYNGHAVVAGDWVWSYTATAVITHNLISGNSGGGISCRGENLIANNLIMGNGPGNYPHTAGGGIRCAGETTISSCTIAGNRADEGGGIYSHPDSLVTMTDNILRDNQAGTGQEIYLNAEGSDAAVLSIEFSNVEGGETMVYLAPGTILNWGAGMIDADPLFATGPLSEYYLDQVAAGQAANSPCLDSGSGAAADICFPAETSSPCMNQLFTRTDSVSDQGQVDMGYHHTPRSANPDTFIHTGPEGTIDSPVVTLTFIGIDETDPVADLVYSHRLNDGPWSEYSTATTVMIGDYLADSHIFQVRARDRDGNVDPTPAMWAFAYQPWVPDEDWQGLVTGPGPGSLNPPLVRTQYCEWLAYGVMRYGVNLATGDLDNDGTDEIVTGPGPGAVFGPHVRCFEPDGTVIAGGGLLAYGTHKFGVNVACGDIDGDGIDEIVTGAGPGPVFGPHVRGWNRDGGPSWTAIPDVSFFAYGTPKWGVNVACGDIDGDGIDEIITGAGPGPVYGAHVRGWNWDGSGSAEAIPGISFFAYGTPRWGVNVACGDINADGRDEIITGPGPGSGFGSHIRGWRFDGKTTVEVDGVNFFAHPGSSYGAVVACGDTDGDGRAEIIFNFGPSAEWLSTCKVYTYQSGGISLLSSFRPYDDWMTHGGRTAVGRFE